MLATSETVALVGTDARPVRVEVMVGPGLPGITIVGLPARSIREAEQRTRSAIESSGLKWPQQKIVANLAPAGLRKEGTHLDLALALGLLAASQQIDSAVLDDWMAMGELGLDGSARPVRGVLAAAIECRRLGRRGLLCPPGNASEAALVDGIEVAPIPNLNDCIAFLKGTWSPPPISPPERRAVRVDDLREVRGQAAAKAALEIAAAGSHNLLMVGPPGSGKTMLARRLPGVLPPMSHDESLEVTRVFSVAGLLGENAGLIEIRPFRSPHHHISVAALIGGGSGLPRPGEVCLAHRGVLFVDELSLYRREVLEALRGPLEDRRVTIARSGGAISFACDFSLIGAMNPCPCGYLGDTRRACRCSDHQIETYRSKLSGPLLDRFDMQIAIKRLTRRELMGEPEGESSEEVAARVARARRRQEERYRRAGATNSSVPRRLFDRVANLETDARRFVGDAIDALALTGRGVDRLVRLARTVADLEGSHAVTGDHVARALELRVMGEPHGAAA